MTTDAPALTPARYLDRIAADGVEIGRLSRAHPDRIVPSCPDWTGTDLIGHLTAFTAWLRGVLLEPGGIAAPLPDVVDPGEAVRDWDSTLAGLLGLLRDVDPADPVPNWSTGPQIAAFWVRRSAQDVSIHRWDAAHLESDEPAPVPADVAVDGLHEYLDVFVTTAFATGGAPENEATLALQVADLGHTLHRDLPHPGPVTTLRGTASDLLLGLWHRVDPLELTVDGDRDLVRAWPRI
ncbi:MAG: maleylpyruvate isomerase family mycothiol-dependent enzyme [Pseudonocardia sp.]|nr:maleylpyruvate isomerase family mycothiol-dependent enzyme [Pseudonocardia sp.]